MGSKCAPQLHLVKLISINLDLLKKFQMLDARQLDALAAVVEHGGFGPAAQALSLSLAAVSLRIKSLDLPALVIRQRP